MHVAAHQEGHQEDVGLRRVGLDCGNLQELVDEGHVGAVRAQVLEVREARVRARILAQVRATHTEQTGTIPCCTT